MYQFPQPPISSASRRRLARHLVGLSLKDIERDLVLETLASTNGNRTTSARLLGLSVRTLRNKITEYSADGAEVTPRRGGTSLGGKVGEGVARQRFAGTPSCFLQRDSIVGDARLEQTTRHALRVRLRPTTSCDLAVGKHLSDNSQRSSEIGLKLLSNFRPFRRDLGEIIRHQHIARCLISLLATATTIFRELLYFVRCIRSRAGIDRPMASRKSDIIWFGRSDRRPLVPQQPS